MLLNKIIRTITPFLLFVPHAIHAQTLLWTKGATSTHTSIRGLSVIDDSVAWIGGSNGWVGTCTDGKHWSFSQVRGYEKYDFRSVYAFDAQTVVIANAGAPAYILRSTDGGTNWQKVYENNDTAAFIDGMDFWDGKNGMAYGDPINGRLLLIRTHDKGRTWKEYSSKHRPIMNPGEASFAASGTSIKCMGRRKIVIATGGKVSRLILSSNKGKSWKPIATPMLQGDAGTGIFSFLPLHKNKWVIAGGDYKRDTLRTANLFITDNAGRSWLAPATTTGGYRECLVRVNKHMLLAIGPAGVDASRDNGNNWAPYPGEKQCHVIKKSRHGNLIICAGSNGTVYAVSKGK